MQPDTVFRADYYFDLPGSNFSELGVCFTQAFGSFSIVHGCLSIEKNIATHRAKARAMQCS
jgi:hypothetical protein